MSKVYLVCPVTVAMPEQTAAIRAYVERLEAEGHQVHWPARDTEQDDPTGGWNVCEQNARAIIAADEIHVWWERTSRGSVFDIGVAWALRMLGVRQTIVLANTFDVPEGKSFEKVLVQWAEVSSGPTDPHTIHCCDCGLEWKRTQQFDLGRVSCPRCLGARCVRVEACVWCQKEFDLPRNGQPCKPHERKETCA